MASITGVGQDCASQACGVIEPKADNPIGRAERHVPRWLRVGHFHNDALRARFGL